MVMSTTESSPVTQRVSTTQVGTSVWILRPEAPLELEVLSYLRRAFRETLAGGARDVVVDLSYGFTFGKGAAATLAAMADEMIARDGVLWISVPWPDGNGFTLRPIRNSGTDGLADVEAVLSGAAAEASSGLGRGLGGIRSKDGGSDEREQERDET